MSAKTIRLYWWSEIYIQKKERENYGDLLGKYLVEKITGRKVSWLRANRFYIKNWWRPVYVTIGSILEHIGSHCIVWGSGMSHRDAQIARATFTAVRGPLSRKRILEIGYDCPEVYGDPALLLPLYLEDHQTKTYELGIIPHINDYKIVQSMAGNSPTLCIIDFLTNEIEETTRQILSCKRIISSSLHGIIVAHAYNIPAVQVKFSNAIFGDGVKYHDYLLSVGLETYDPLLIENQFDSDYWMDHVDKHKYKLPDQLTIKNLQDGLMKACPFLSGEDER
ncbi:polysaccharide pyruvyl transferase family protein [Nonlabens agnitus]|uniref:Exosortase n=1 Tax=Nonlabens agnitus TaxID=870484 RepID=A0A2S9WU56_9FLAO|nr:polysaccharide pyruvyl transferase family protein [Nonlabens agnitus]PRP67004.1 exosortase [Nonlabens agnitus]